MGHWGGPLPPRLCCLKQPHTPGQGGLRRKAKYSPDFIVSMSFSFFGEVFNWVIIFLVLVACFSWCKSNGTMLGYIMSLLWALCQNLSGSYLLPAHLFPALDWFLYEHAGIRLGPQDPPSVTEMQFGSQLPILQPWIDSCKRC